MFYLVLWVKMYSNPSCRLKILISFEPRLRRETLFVEESLEECWLCHQITNNLKWLSLMILPRPSPHQHMIPFNVMKLWVGSILILPVVLVVLIFWREKKYMSINGEEFTSSTCSSSIAEDHVCFMSRQTQKWTLYGMEGVLGLPSRPICFFLRNKFIRGPLILHRIWFSSLNPKTRYNRSLNCQNWCKTGPSAVWKAVLADRTPTWLVWLGLHPTWHWRGAYVAIISRKNNKSRGPTYQLWKKKFKMAGLPHRAVFRCFPSRLSLFFLIAPSLGARSGAASQPAERWQEHAGGAEGWSWNGAWRDVQLGRGDPVGEWQVHQLHRRHAGHPHPLPLPPTLPLWGLQHRKSRPPQHTRADHLGQRGRGVLGKLVRTAHKLFE